MPCKPHPPKRLITLLILASSIFILHSPLCTEVPKALTMFSCTASAQIFKERPDIYARHELSAGFGLGGFSNMKRYDSFKSDVMSTHNLNYGSLCGLGAIIHTLNLQLSYLYHFNQRLAAGISIAGYVHNNDPLDNYTDVEPEPEQLIDAYATTSCISILPTIKYTWGYWKEVAIYSKAATGIYRQRLKFKSNDDYYAEINQIDWRLAHQLTPLGFEIAADRFLLFGELGWGVNGFVNAGCSIQLGKRLR